MGFDREKFDEIKAAFTIDDDALRKIADDFRADMCAGLAGKEGATLRMLRSYAGLPSGKEHGSFLALDFGGTNVRALRILLKGGGEYEVLSKVAKPLTLPGVYDYVSADATAEEMFDFLAGIIDEAGKGLVLVVSKWDSVEGKDAYTRDELAPQISYHFKFTPYAPLIFTSSVTGQNVAKLFDLALDIYKRRRQECKTRALNDLLQKAVAAHPPAGLKNSHPKLRYIVQTDIAPPWFVIYGSNLKFVHWSYKRYLERTLREAFNFAGTPIKLSFRDEKQLKANRERVARGLAPVTKAYKQAKNAEKDI